MQAPLVRVHYITTGLYNAKKAHTPILAIASQIPREIGTTSNWFKAVRSGVLGNMLAGVDCDGCGQCLGRYDTMESHTCGTR